jgi:hypothetical protein
LPGRFHHRCRPWKVSWPASRDRTPTERRSYWPHRPCTIRGFFGQSTGDGSRRRGW